MESNEKVAIFDFCETLIKFQTADAFIDFVLLETKSIRMFAIELFRRLLFKLRVNLLFKSIWDRKSINKQIRLYELKGIKRNVLIQMAGEFYTKRLKPNIIPEVLSQMIIKKNEGYKIGIVSGGLSIYIDMFCEDYYVDFCISSKLQYKNEKSTGKLEGMDCMGENKVEALSRILKFTPSYSIVYTDSITDLPLLQWANDGVVVSRNKHQNWINTYNFKEIIWTELN